MNGQAVLAAGIPDGLRAGIGGKRTCGVDAVKIPFDPEFFYAGRQYVCRYGAYSGKGSLSRRSIHHIKAANVKVETRANSGDKKTEIESSFERPGPDYRHPIWRMKTRPRMISSEFSRQWARIPTVRFRFLRTT